MRSDLDLEDRVEIGTNSILMTVPKLYDAVFQRGESRWRLITLKSRSFEDCSN